MRRDVQEIFRNTPHEKQVMMFSATLSKEIRPVCKKFMQDVISLHSFSHWPCSNGVVRRMWAKHVHQLAASSARLCPKSLERTVFAQISGG